MNNAIGQGEYPILPEIKIPLPVGDELPVPVIQGGVSLNKNWDKNGNIFYTDENGNKVNDYNFFNNIGNKVKAFGANVNDLLNPLPHDRRDTQYTSPYEVLKEQYDKGAISQNELINLANNRLEDDIYRAEKEQKENNLRAGLGSAVSGFSFHPALNIPYVGTGIGGAMYDVGQGIVEGETLPDLLDRAKRGFVIGETVGAIPYAGKGINKLSGGRIGDVMQKGVNRIAETPFMQKANDILMTDIIPNSNKQPIYYHGTAANFDNFSPEYFGTAHDEGIYGKGFYFTPHKSLAQSYADSARNGTNPRVIAANLEMKNPLVMENFNSAEDLAKYLDMEENIGDFIRADYNGKTIFRPNGFLQNTGKFKGRVQDLGHDGVIVGNNEAVVFNPEQIKQIEPQSLFDYLKNDSILTQGYRDNKNFIDKSILSAKRKIDLGINPFEKTKTQTLYNKISNTHNNIVDLTNSFSKNPTIAEVKAHIQNLINNGIKYDTLSPDWKIDIIGGKTKADHIVKSSQYGKMNKSKVNRHNKYIASIEDLINNSTYSSSKTNTKIAKKPNIDTYHYFETNVKIGNKQYKVILNAEQFKGESTIKPQTVHLYDVIEVK